MELHCEKFISPSSKLSRSPTVTAFDSSLTLCVKNFKDLLLEYEQVLIELESCRKELSKQQDLCKSKTCESAESLQRVIDSKNTKIDSVASMTTQLNETRNWSIIDNIFRIICGETTTLIPPKDNATDKKQQINVVSCKTTPIKKLPTSTCNTNKSTTQINIKKENVTPVKQRRPTPKKRTQTPNRIKTSLKKEIVTPDKDISSSLEDISFKEENETLSEIDVTPRAESPVLKRRTGKNSLLGLGTSNTADKKKCPNDWTKSEAKQLKLSHVATPGRGRGGIKQSQLRFTTVACKESITVDLTGSTQSSGDSMEKENVNFLGGLMEKVSNVNNETILPSPTRDPEFEILKTSKDREGQSRSKRPLSLKHKIDLQIDSKTHSVSLKGNLEDHKGQPLGIKGQPMGLEGQPMDPKGHVEVKSEESSVVVSFPFDIKVAAKVVDLDESINIFNPKRLKSPKKSPKEVKDQNVAEPTDYDVTNCDTLPEIQEEKDIQKDKPSLIIALKSPTKRPLCENKNITNLPPGFDAESSMSLLTRFEVKGDPEVNVKGDCVAKRKTPEKVEPIYKEPTVRKKAEKMALPAWLCEECKAFVDALYDDPDPAKVAALIAVCGKHRGRRNPIRPNTPTGFWDPRWDVPEDTEEFNKKNGVA